MVIDGDNNNSFKKNKSIPIKKVRSVISPIDFFLNQFYLYLLQIPEKCPEVRLLEYCEVPGITKGPEYLAALKVTSNTSKRAKVAHPSTDQGTILLLSS